MTKRFGCTLKEASATIQEVGARGQYLAYDEHDEAHEGGDRDVWVAAPVADPRSLIPLRLVNEIVDAAVSQTDIRALRRLEEIGRPAFALELVEKERARIAARNDEAQYLYQPLVARPRASFRRKQNFLA